MHYKNGREAKNGDKVMVFPSYGAPYVGVMYDSVAGNDYCNGKVVPISPTDPMVNLREALHLDDVRAFLPRAKAMQGNDIGQNLEAVPDVSEESGLGWEWKA